MIVVLGMRSGSSLVAQLLHKQGIDMGSKFQGATPHNQTGYYENLDFLHYSISLHDELGRERFVDPIKREDLDRVPLKKIYALRDLVSQYRREMWGVKVPTMAYWLPLLELFETPDYILCVRDMGEMANSLKKYGHDVPKDFDWLRYVERYCNVMENATYDRRRLKVDYHDILMEPENVIRKIMQFAGLSPTNDRIEELASLVRPDLNHESPKIEGRSVYRPRIRVSPNPSMTFSFEESDD